MRFSAPVVKPRRDGELEVCVREVIQSRYGYTIGLIVGVWRDGFYQGSYFEQVKEIPASAVGHCRNTAGVNGAYHRNLLAG